MRLLIAAWVTCTFFASLAGGKFVEASKDCLTPTSLAQAAAAVVYLSRGWSVHSSDCSRQQHGLQFSAKLALGLLQLLSSSLTLACFGLIGITETYLVRALEPICSSILLCVLHRRHNSSRELVLMSVVVASIWCVVYANKAASTASDVLTAHHHPPQATSLRDRYIPVGVALVATAAVSFKSIVAQALAAATGQTELDLFQQSAVPGLTLVLVLRGVMWVLFGTRPMQWLQGELAADSSLAAALLVMFAAFQCASDTISFRVLHYRSPVLHAAMNALKRLFVVFAGIISTGARLSRLQLFAFVIANTTAALLATEQPTYIFSSTASGWSALPGYKARSSQLDQHLSKGPKAGLDAGLLPNTPNQASQLQTGQLLVRLAYMMSAIILACVFALAYVLVAHQQAGSTGANLSTQLATSAGAA